MKSFQFDSINKVIWLSCMVVVIGCGDKNIFLKDQIESDKVNVSSADTSQTEVQTGSENSKPEEPPIDSGKDSSSTEQIPAKTSEIKAEIPPESVLLEIPEPSLFLTDDQLKFPSGEVRTVFEGEMDQYLKLNENLKNPFDAARSGKDIFESELCPEKLWRTLVFKTFGPGQILVDQEVDFECDPGPVDSSGMELKRTVTVKGHYYLWATCEGTDLSSYNEKSMAGINPIKKGLYFNLCPNSSEMNIALQYNFTVDHKFSYIAFTKDAYRNSIQTAFSYSFSKDGSFCSVKISNGIYSVDQCDEVYWEQDLNFTSYKNDVLDRQTAQVTSSYQKNIMSQISYDLISPRFQSGKVTFIQNNWEGDMDYSGGGKYRYQAKSTQGPTLSGGNE